MNAEFWAGKEMSGDKGSTEGPRIVIEASVLVVTLLFIVTQLGTCSDKPPVIGSMAGIGSVFILAAIFATLPGHLKHR